MDNHPGGRGISPVRCRSGYERCFVRLFRLAAATVVLIGPLAVLAQHSAPPAPSPIVSHVAPPAASVPIPSISTPHGLTTPRTGSQDFHPGTRTSSEPQSSRPNNTVSFKSGTIARSQGTGFLSFLHRRSDIRCRSGACVPPTTPIKRVVMPDLTLSSYHRNPGCTLVGVPNPAIPCNVYAPCCL